MHYGDGLWTYHRNLLSINQAQIVNELSLLRGDRFEYTLNTYIKHFHSQRMETLMSLQVRVAHDGWYWKTKIKYFAEIQIQCQCTWSGQVPGDSLNISYSLTFSVPAFDHIRSWTIYIDAQESMHIVRVPVMPNIPGNARFIFMDIFWKWNVRFRA